MTAELVLRVERVADLPSARPLIAARHAIFCLGQGGEVLQRCSVERPGDPHDQYDELAWHFGVSYLPHQQELRDIIMTARLIPGPSVRATPTGQLLHRLQEPPPIVPGEQYSEPSRLGLFKQYQRTELGLRAVLRMAGALAETSVEEGYHNFLLSLRPALMVRLHWFPWALAPAISYPESEGGPLTHEPIWLATLNLHELVVATKLLATPHDYQAMFPREPTWVDPDRVRPKAQLREVIDANRAMVRETLVQYRRGNLTLATLAPA